MNFNTSNVITNAGGSGAGGVGAGGGGALKFDGNIKDTIMYYQTTLRNVGLFTSVSVALFTFSKFFADTLQYNSKTIRIFIRLLSIFVLGISSYMCYNLYNDVSNLKKYTNLHNNNTKLIDIDNWHNLLLFVLFVLIVLLFICIYVFYTDVRYNRFHAGNLTHKSNFGKKMKEFSVVNN